MLLSWKLIQFIKISTSQNFKNTFKYSLTWIFLSVWAQLKKPLCPRTPCKILSNKFKSSIFVNKFFPDSNLADSPDFKLFTISYVWKGVLTNWTVNFSTYFRRLFSDLFKHTSLKHVHTVLNKRGVQISV